MGCSGVISAIDDGDVHTAHVDYTPGTLRIYLDDSLLLAVSLNLSDTLSLDDGKAWVGFTAATGRGFEAHDILSWSFTEVPITISGNVDLLDYDSDPNKEITVSFHLPDDPNTTIDETTVVLDANGDYSFTTTLIGTYDIAFRTKESNVPNDPNSTCHWLRQRVHDVELTTSQVTVDVNLINGDVNGDNKVDFSDYLVIIAHFNQTVAPDTRGDLNGDGAVNFEDYLINSRNFGAIGDPPARLP